MLNATWLHTFTVLCETRNFTQAARRLNMTQPGVSQHLRKLEDQLGHPLIAQQGKRLSLTPAGEAVRAVGIARQEEERRLREAIATDDPDVGAVSLACSGSFALFIAPRIYALMADAPLLEIHLEATPQSGVLSGVLEGRFDLGLVGRDPGHPRLEASRLGHEQVCLVLPASYAGKPVVFEELEELGFIAHPDGYRYADDLLSLNFPDVFTGADRLRMRAHVNQIGQIPALVAQGLGYTLLPRSGVAAFVHPELLHIAPLPQRRFDEVWLISLRGRPLSARVQRMKDLVSEVADTLAKV